MKRLHAGDSTGAKPSSGEKVKTLFSPVWTSYSGTANVISRLALFASYLRNSDRSLRQIKTRSPARSRRKRVPLVSSVLAPCRISTAADVSSSHRRPGEAKVRLFPACTGELSRPYQYLQPGNHRKTHEKMNTPNERRTASFHVCDSSHLSFSWTIFPHR